MSLFYVPRMSSEALGRPRELPRSRTASDSPLAIGSMNVLFWRGVYFLDAQSPIHASIPITNPRKHSGLASLGV